MENARYNLTIMIIGSDLSYNRKLSFLVFHGFRLLDIVTVHQDLQCQSQSQCQLREKSKVNICLN